MRKMHLTTCLTSAPEDKSQMSLIYCIEDDSSIRELVTYTLETTGFSARGFEDGSSFYKAIEEDDLPDLILIDIMLPGVDGMEILHQIKKQAETKKIPVIMLTAKGAEYDKVMALDMGADDYVTKPFGMMELISRIRAVLRRTAGEKEPDNSLRYGRFELNEMKHSFHLNGKAIDLTNKEFELMKRLLSNPEIVIPRSSLIDEIWGHDFSGESRTLDVHIATLRQKLGEAGDCIETVRGIGYRMRSKQRKRNHEKANLNF